jgi:hypothetical protein
MHGYQVVTSDDRRVGTVVGIRQGFLIVESGRLRRSRHPVPREFVHPNDEAAKVFVTVPRRLLMDAPKAGKDGEFDRAAAARHFGLAAPSASSGLSEHRRALLLRRLLSARSD